MIEIWLSSGLDMSNIRISIYLYWWSASLLGDIVARERYSSSLKAISCFNTSFVYVR